LRWERLLVEGSPSVQSFYRFVDLLKNVAKKGRAACGSLEQGFRLEHTEFYEIFEAGTILAGFQV
jgi:hypothetical protein